MDFSSGCWTSAAALGVVLGSFLFSQATPRPQAQPSPLVVPAPAVGNKVLLIYDEQVIPDKERAKLCQLITRAVPSTQWPKVKARGGESLWG